MGKPVPLRSPVQLRRAFRLAAKPVARARLYATALGLYQAYVNGSRVGRDELAPGWTDYRKRVQYQTYDITDAVRGGANAVGVTLAPAGTRGTSPGSARPSTASGPPSTPGWRSATPTAPPTTSPPTSGGAPPPARCSAPTR
ncbi:alpha-L-rhamnosidase N-terminal domain-containing protein [Streptomyces sp. M19]